MEDGKRAKSIFLTVEKKPNEMGRSQTMNKRNEKKVEHAHL